ncbi:MAG: PIN domain-containing protein [Nitrospira sp.]|nr:PIN domain-containing protein [Nitrospira sp.]MDE0405637.1 PIN domain-containing protein [Nitrospira sp.]MDE0486710.1 PIN domain-containing protein [Nitrospira sp.]
MYLLDTDILANLMGRCPSTPLIAKLASVPPGQQCTSSVTLEELLVGASRFGRRSAALLSQVDARLIPNLQVLSFDAEAARRYGALHASLARKGSPVSETALRVAAIALVRDLTLVSGNPQYFKRVPGLSVENWLE